MTTREIEADYLVVGAGLAGMAFADSLLSESTANIVMADRGDRPGGHWTDAYPFVRLHQPAAAYGVNSLPLSPLVKDEVGLNAGFYSLASGSEVLAHFDRVMHQRLLPSGRVRFFPLSEVNDGVIRSLVTGDQTRIRARKIVDATYSKMAIPATHRRPFGVAPGITCVPPGELPRTVRGFKRYVIVGGGKTAMDVCTWLLRLGVPPDQMQWIRPRDSWVLNRSRYQPGDEFFVEVLTSIANQVQVLAEAESVSDAFARLEEFEEVFRLDPSIEPTMYHGATLSEAEVEELRRITNVVRLGRVRSIQTDEILLERDSIPATPEALYIDCSAAGIPPREPRPIFERDRITIQWIRRLQPSLSAAILGYVEAVHADDAEKNRLCRPMSPPNSPRDWLVMMQIDLANLDAARNDPQLAAWEAASRLALINGRIRSMDSTQSEARSQLARYVQHIPAAISNLGRLLEQEL